MSESQNQVTAVKKNPFRVWGLFAVVLVLFVGCQSPTPKGADHENRGSETATQQVGIAWLTDFEKAKAESAATGKPILLDFSASWCPPCQVMKHEVWPDPLVGQAAGTDFIPVLVDIDIPENKALAQKYGVSSIPRIILVDSEGKIQKQAGYMTAPQLLEFVGASLSPSLE